MIIIRPLLIMNIVVAIIVGLNVLQNASKCTISKEKCQNFSGEWALDHPDHISRPPNFKS